MVAASRVIEIDDVLVASRDSGFSTGQTCAKDLALDLLVFRGGFDDQIAFGQVVKVFTGADPVQGSNALLFGDDRLINLARHIAIDRRQTRVDLVDGDVIQHDVVAGERTDMRNAVAHLPGADNTDFSDIETHVGPRSP